MVDSTGVADDSGSGDRMCDFCRETTAVVYCRADSAKLCLACDRNVHSTNALFTKHTRAQLCDACDKSPATVLCSTEDVVLCQNCDWETHNKVDLSSVHDRKFLEGFCGCPKVCELMGIFGLEDLGKKGLDEKEGFDESADFGLSEFLVWDTPVFNLDDLIGGGADSVSGFGFEEIEAPSMPKVVKATCGRHKEEILRQLREMVKTEPGFSYDCEDGFNASDRVLQPVDVLIGDSGRDEKPCVGDNYEEKALRWFDDSNKSALQVPILKICNTVGSGTDGLVPENKSETSGCPTQSADGHVEGIIVPNKTDVLPFVPKVHSHEFNSQKRDTALLRYKEKKKNRRYDKLIRYETRKVRAESRTRIKGRFAKSTDQ